MAGPVASGPDPAYETSPQRVLASGVSARLQRGSRFTLPLVAAGVVAAVLIATSFHPASPTPIAAGDNVAPGASAAPSDGSSVADTFAPTDSAGPGDSLGPTDTPTDGPSSAPTQPPNGTPKPTPTRDPYVPSNGPVEGTYPNLDMVLTGPAPVRLSWITPGGTYTCGQVLRVCFFGVKPGTSGTLHWTIPAGTQAPAGYTIGYTPLTPSGTPIPGDGPYDFSDRAFTMPAYDAGIGADFQYVVATPKPTPVATPTPTPAPTLVPTSAPTPGPTST
jgi:hypothetical protein